MRHPLLAQGVRGHGQLGMVHRTMLATSTHRVHGREGGERTFNHPADGFLRYEQITFNLASQPDVKLTMLVETGKDAATLPAKLP